MAKKYYAHSLEGELTKKWQDRLLSPLVLVIGGIWRRCGRILGEGR